MRTRCPWRRRLPGGVGVGPWSDGPVTRNPATRNPPRPSVGPRREAACPPGPRSPRGARGAVDRRGSVARPRLDGPRIRWPRRRRRRAGETVTAAAASRQQSRGRRAARWRPTSCRSPGRCSRAVDCHEQGDHPAPALQGTCRGDDGSARDRCRPIIVRTRVSRCIRAPTIAVPGWGTPPAARPRSARSTVPSGTDVPQDRERHLECRVARCSTRHRARPASAMPKIRHQSPRTSCGRAAQRGDGARAPRRPRSPVPGTDCCVPQIQTGQRSWVEQARRGHRSSLAMARLHDRGAVPGDRDDDHSDSRARHDQQHPARPRPGP